MASFACLEQCRIYDDTRRLSYRFDDNGRTYERDWSPGGRVKNGTVYENDRCLKRQRLVFQIPVRSPSL